MKNRNREKTEWDQGSRKEMELYIHIPFCVKKCAYCDFLSFPADETVQRKYVECLLKEIREMGKKYHKYTISTIFVGGGTPSILKSQWIVEIIDCIRSVFSVSLNAEISMEANPGTVTKGKLADYRIAGINRLSFGLQSADNQELMSLGRIHSWETFLESYHLAREAGFSNLNIDLMSALPGQTVDSWLDTLGRVTALFPEHISAYSLMIEEDTPFYEKYGSCEGKRLLPDEDSERAMYHQTKAFLADSGYARYEISNYARPGFECRHNIGYWTGVPYLGVGLGASSYMEGTRFLGLTDIKKYMSAPPGTHGEIQKLTQKDLQEEFFYVGLRMVNGVSLKEFERRFGQSVHDIYKGLIPRLESQGLVICKGERLCLTDYGMDVSNYVMAEFLQDE